MTQRTLATTVAGRSVTVLMGWDRRLQYHFMVIGADGDHDEPLYSNLDDPQAGLTGTVDYFAEKARSFGILIPSVMLDRVRDDAFCDKGNDVSCFDGYGNETCGG